MIRMLRRRFIWGAMGAFSILLVLVIGGMIVASYMMLERDSERFLSMMLDNVNGYTQPASPAMFGYEPGERMFPAGFYDIATDATGEIVSVQSRGIVEDAGVSVQNCVAEILRTTGDSGKVGAYKYRVQRNADGSARMILLDNAIALQGLYNMLRGALAVGAVCWILLFCILQPVASKVARSYGRNVERQKQFITNASHEMKTPVAIILANLDALELHGGESRWSANIRAQVGRMSGMLRQLLMMARMDERQLRAQEEQLDFAAVLQNLLTTYDERLEARGLSLVTQVPPSLLLRGNREALEQLLVVLLDNAMQYTNRGGRISIALQSIRGQARLAVENTVDALPDCEPDALFERFYRGDAAHSQSSGGCGIGLSAAQSIVQMHGGHIHASYPQQDVLRIQCELPQGAWRGRRRHKGNRLMKRAGKD